MGRGTWAATSFLVAAVLAVVGLALAAGLALAGHDLANERDDLLVPILALAALAALAGWAEARRRLAAAREFETELALEEQLRRQRRDDLVSKVEASERALAQEQRAHRQLKHSYDTQRQWTRELRRQIVELNRQRGALADPKDVPSLVLRTAMALVGASKGLLLSREDENSDGDLDLIAHAGFDHDPTHSAVAQRFAREVIASDQTVREDEVEPQSSNPADREIENLAAIPIYVRDRFDGVVVCANKPAGFDEHEDEVLLALGDHAGAVLQNARLHGRLRTSYLATVAMLAEAVEAKDPFLRGHSDDVSGYVGGVAARLGLDERTREALVFGSLLHDVGKIGITERILLKPAGLTPEERAIVELHPRIGYRLVQRVPELREIAPAILHHHERYDGDGYPSGLAAEQIPLEARIIAVADSFSAMTSDRPYRARMSVDEACDELTRCAGTQFDPEIVRLFLEEVRAAPPQEGEKAITEALADPEIEVQRNAGEPLLGYGSTAVIDSLTLLYSRRHFHEAAHAAAEQARIQDQPFAVVVAELTDIARVNAEDGWATGDDAIQEVARCVQSVAVQCGGTPCRYSGRRIGMVVPGTDENAVERLADQIVSGLADGPAVRVVTAVSQNGETGEDVVDRVRAELLAGAVGSAGRQA